MKNLIAFISASLIVFSVHAAPKKGLVQEGAFVFDKDKRLLKSFMANKDLVIDHMSKSGYEVYGPAGLIKWIKILGLNYLDLAQINQSNEKAFAQYPTPEEVGSAIKKLVNDNPDILKLQSLGKSREGRDLWMVKLSDNVQVDEVEPEVKYIANMHGDEIVGRELMVLLLEDLVERYRLGEQDITRLIDNSEVYIMPSMNPDGANRKIRGNGSWVDLNRDFPDFTTSDNRNTRDGREPETQAIMDFQATRKFALSANFHGGTEVVNYPWDTSPDPAPLTPLIESLSREYASQVPSMRDSREFQDGIVNGYAWYEVDGGMQDWSYNWYGDLQVTIELSHSKWPNYSTIPGYFAKNRWSLVRYLLRVHQGAGFYFDDRNTSGKAKIVKLEANGSETVIGEFPFTGEYYKILEEGNYRFEVSGGQQGSQSFVTKASFSAPARENGNYHQLN
jgi:hypothetical protein